VPVLVEESGAALVVAHLTRIDCSIDRVGRGIPTPIDKTAATIRKYRWIAGAATLVRARNRSML